ncbi:MULTISPECIES: SDR family oxidoreductase [unclassified Streptomyces]|uniref:SDR family oxidoreductase n=1 Tax=unclassified Streptomyces TaxID=2593676 RepID=UPI0004ABA03B|nr:MULTISPECIES: SDR family oxidoreductase [unclassified Streptomyces]APU39365.1 nucleoside-diphosphate sugar epimerase [Streptomyces sp. TN58]KJK45385.1 nucleoside-diphosphate sugar epimerase [Streptomyces sp. NRRL F-4428]
MSAIVVTGGTGTLGSLVTERLRAAGHEVRVLSRHAPDHPVDLRNGAGLDAALAGAEVVVHCASDARGGGRGDVAAAGNLIAAARRAGTVRNIVYISIVGVDVVPLGYYRRKLQVERLLEASGLGVTILRTTQFHDLVAMVTDALAKLPVVPIPKGVRVQPIAVGEVAARMAELAVPTPSGRVPDMGGPEIHALPDLARTYLSATGRSRRVLPVPFPGKAYAGFRRGGNLTPSRAVGKERFAHFARERGR